MIKIILLIISFLFLISPVNAFSLEEQLISDIIIDEPLNQIITFLSFPLNWLILFGSYIGIYIAQLIKKDIDYNKIIIYGTITWVIILLIMTIGFNMLFLNYAFLSPSILLAFITFIIFGFFNELLIVAIISFFASKK